MTAVGAGLLAAACCHGAYCIAPTYWHKWFRPLPRRLPAADKAILLTFDDGPDPRYTGKILDILREYDVRSVFFVVAGQARLHPELIGRMRGEGHAVGLHSLNHRSAWRLTPEAVKRDFEESLSILRGLGCTVRYYRPPWGQVSLTSLREAKKHGLTTVLWTVMAQDWEKDSTAERILRRLDERVTNGSVICLHDAGADSRAASGAPEETVRALPAFLRSARERGYRFLLPDGDII